MVSCGFTSHTPEGQKKGRFCTVLHGCRVTTVVRAGTLHRLPVASWLTLWLEATKESLLGAGARPEGGHRR